MSSGKQSDEIDALKKEIAALNKKADSYEHDIDVLREILKHLKKQFSEFRKGVEKK
jgi:predicted  nucleic acid-binding Zn-ribbon protein